MTLWFILNKELGIWRFLERLNIKNTPEFNKLWKLWFSVDILKWILYQVTTSFHTEKFFFSYTILQSNLYFFSLHILFFQIRFDIFSASLSFSCESELFLLLHFHFSLLLLLNPIQKVGPKSNTISENWALTKSHSQKDKNP